MEDQLAIDNIEVASLDCLVDGGNQSSLLGPEKMSGKIVTGDSFLSPIYSLNIT